MRGSTMVWLGLRHVGKGDLPDQVQEVSVSQALRKITEFIAKESLATRFEIVIARTESEVIARLNNTVTRGVSSESMTAELDALFAELETEAE